MNSDLDLRAVTIIERYRTKRAQYRRDHPASNEAITHDRVVAEVPILAAKIDRAVGDFNDRASEAGLRVRVGADEGPHVCLTIFKIFAIGIFEPALVLKLSINNDGCVFAFISNGSATTQLKKLSIFGISEAQIFELILDLVEREIELERH